MNTKPEVNLDLIKAVVFDCDGVMFDSIEANTVFYNQLLERFAQSPLTAEERIFVHMHAVNKCIVHLFKNRGPEGERLLPAAMEAGREFDYTSFIPYMIMEPGLLEALDWLKPRYTTAISTNRSTTMPLVIEKFGLEGKFDLIVTALDVEHPKPHPESLFKILRFFSLRPEEALYVGDSELDELAAEKSGVIFVSYNNPDLRAHFRIERLLELKTLLSGR